MEKIHTNWDYMRPRNDEKYEDFKFEEYYQRISKNNNLNHIPKTVFEQWIYYHHQEPNTLDNYAWINYENIEFVLCKWELEKFEKVSVIDNFMDYYSDRASYLDLNQFCCTQKDLKVWIENGTWRVPPIIIDVSSLKTDIPTWSQLKPPYQLVEGHTRFGYLQSMKRISELGKADIAKRHSIYLMREI